jgi:5-methylcytosine-specific restriction protein A
LFRSHSQRGLIGVGTFTSEVESRRRRDGSGRLANAIEFRLSRLVSAEDRVSVESLLRHVPEVPWNGLQGSGAQVKDQALAKVFKLWDARAERGLAAPEELVESDRFEEGAVVQVRANRYERDWGAREACIARWGTTCAACGFDFEKVYGTIGKGFIHVHHLRDLASIGRRYEVDPEKDLRPLCANCHAMIHRERPAMPLEALKRRFASALIKPRKRRD